MLFVLLSFFFWPLCCLFFYLQILITPLVSFGHCVVCSSIYGFWLPLWYLLAIVLSVLLFTDSDYPFGIFWPLCCLFFYLQILITALVSFGHCVVCSSIYRFWLPLWYLQTLLYNSYIIQICFLTPCELWTPCKRNNFLVCFQSFLPCSGRQIFAGMTEKKIMINKNGITDLQHKVQHSFRKLC